MKTAIFACGLMSLLCGMLIGAILYAVPEVRNLGDYSISAAHIIGGMVLMWIADNDPSL